MASSERRPTGSKRPLSDDDDCRKWELRAGVRSSATGKLVQRSRRFSGTGRQADKAAAALAMELAADVANGTPQDRTRRTVADLLDEWLTNADRIGKQRPKTVKENRYKIDGRIVPVLGAYRLDKISARDIDAAYEVWMDEDDGPGLSPATVHKYHSILLAAFNQGKKWGWVDRASNPMDDVTPPVLYRGQMTIPTIDQVVAIVDHLDKRHPVAATAVALAALTGMRRGELCALQWDDLDLIEGRVTVSKGITVVNGEAIVGPTKTHATRAPDLLNVALDVLRRRWEYMQELSQRADTHLVTNPYILSYNADGATPIDPDTLSHRFHDAVVAMEKPAMDILKETMPDAIRGDLDPAEQWPFRFHDLRHFAITTMITSGMDVRTVGGIVGHSRASMTLDRYSHFLPERAREAAGVLDTALEGLTSRGDQDGCGATVTKL